MPLLRNGRAPREVAARGVFGLALPPRRASALRGGGPAEGRCCATEGPRGPAFAASEASAPSDESERVRLAGPSESEGGLAASKASAPCPRERSARGISSF